MLCTHDRRDVVGLWRVNYFSKPSKREASCRHVESTFPRVEIPPFVCMRKNGKALRPTPQSYLTDIQETRQCSPVFFKRLGSFGETYDQQYHLTSLDLARTDAVETKSYRQK